MITDKEHWEITNCTADFNIPRFSFQEVQEFLINLGYTMYIHEALCTVEMVDMDMGDSVEHTGKFFEEKRKRILALSLKAQNKDILFYALPSRIDSAEAKELDFRTVFNKEIKKKLLGV